MRLIGHLAEEPAARTFGDYLYVQGIENQIDREPGDGWGIWIRDEDRIEEATKLLATFRENPSDPRYQAHVKAAAERRAAQEKAEEVYREKQRTRRHLFRSLTSYGFGPLTFGLIVGSIVVFVLSKFGTHLQPIEALFITAQSTSLPEIRHGQVWRLVTPIFIHFNILHIFFNMLWLRDLGSMIEGRQSTWTLAALVLVIAAGSNLAQVHFGGSPLFGGMSGVVYGLLGYIWMRGRYDPGSGLYLHQSTVVMMLIWLVLCFTGMLGPVANTAHLAGLVMGMAWGYLSSRRYR